MNKLALLLLSLMFCITSRAEDGSQLWLRYQTQNKANIVGPETLASTELKNYYLGKEVRLLLDSAIPNEGYKISKSNDTTIISAKDEIGLLYGAYALLRSQKYQKTIRLNVVEKPFFKYRILNHWDNLDGSIERGYAGNSIFWNEALEDSSKPLEPIDIKLLTEYARANASLGINGTVINNVNASPKVLSEPYIKKVEKIAAIFRPYGIKVYLSINFASPMALGKLNTADPLDKRVKAWWKMKAKEIYKIIPDFGGFLVKANSEGQPGPGDYKRSHAQGANMLADAVAPYGGIIMWRSFVYGANHKGEDRVKQAVSEFINDDGKFRPNVILQSKNGPLDFQPREPYAPIFDNMTKTPQMVELQITQEYLGQSRHLVYLAPMWREFFSFVAPEKLIGIAGVANIGLDKNWCGHHFSQANWYAFGRLAWDPTLKSEDIAEEWLAQTFDLKDNQAIKSMMLRSREACVDYMMPLGLHHIFQFDHHYGPDPGGFKPEYPIEWCPVYYHRADSIGVGFNRTHTGTDATSQYREPYCSMYDDITTCPERYLLWFHHVPWNYRLNNGNTLWEEIQNRYKRGTEEVEDFCTIWKEAKPQIDEQRWNEVEERMQLQLEDAHEWQHTCINYFKTFIK